MAQYTIDVSGMSCTSCETMVRQAVTTLEGVATVDPDHESGEVVVTGDPDTEERAKQAISETGYVVES